MQPPEWPSWVDPARIAYVEGRAPSVRFTQPESPSGHGFVVEVTSSGLITFNRGAGEHQGVVLARSAAEALAAAIEFLNVPPGTSLDQVQARIDGDHWPIRVARPIGADGVIVSARPETGRPWLVSMRRSVCEALVDALKTASELVDAPTGESITSASGFHEVIVTVTRPVE